MTCPLNASTWITPASGGKSANRRLIAARETQRPVGKNPLGIRDVPENFLYGPFSRGIPETPVPFASPGEQLQHLQSLGFENAQDIGARNFRYVIRVVLGVFRRLGSVHRLSSLLEPELYRSAEFKRTSNSEILTPRPAGQNSDPPRARSESPLFVLRSIMQDNACL